MKKLKRILFRSALVLVGLVCVLVIGAVVVARQNPAGSLKDNELLPQGPFKRPTQAELAKDSVGVVNLRLSLEAIWKIINQLKLKLSHSQKIRGVGDVGGNVHIKDVRLYRVTNERVKLTANWHGKLKHPYTGINLDVSGYGEAVVKLALNSNWEIELQDPTLSLTVLKPALVPDFVNTWLAVQLTDQLRQNPQSLKGLVEGPWRDAQQVLLLGAPANASLHFRPTEALLAPLFLDEKTQSLKLVVGAKFQAWGGLDPDDAGRVAEVTSPKLKMVDSLEPLSDVSLPIFFKITELAGLLRQTNIDWEDGHVHISKAEFSDKDGYLWMRFHLDAQLPSSAENVGIEKIEGSIVARVKVGCDQSGKVRIEDFAFSSKTDNLLIDVVGPVLTESLKGNLKALINSFLTELLSSMDGKLESIANNALLNIRDHLAVSTPDWAPLVKSGKADVSELKVTPEVIRVDDGYLMITLRAKSKLSLVLE